MSDLSLLKENGEAPEWMNEEGFKTLSAGYLLDQETPKQMYQRVSKAAASYYQNSDEYEKKFFHILWNNWLCPASPVLSNMGTNRGLPISCNTIHVDDSVDSIFSKNHELAILSKNGAGVGFTLEIFEVVAPKLKAMALLKGPFLGPRSSIPLLFQLIKAQLDEAPQPSTCQLIMLILKNSLISDDQPET